CLLYIAFNTARQPTVQVGCRRKIACPGQVCIGFVGALRRLLTVKCPVVERFTCLDIHQVRRDVACVLGTSIFDRLTVFVNVEDVLLLAETQQDVHVGFVGGFQIGGQRRVVVIKNGTVTA